MIYSRQECDIIGDILNRKEMERTIYASMDLPVSLKNVIDDHFELDIDRCNSM